MDLIIFGVTVNLETVRKYFYFVFNRAPIGRNVQCCSQAALTCSCCLFVNRGRPTGKIWVFLLFLLLPGQSQWGSGESRALGFSTYKNGNGDKTV